MKKDKNTLAEAAELRRRGEERLREKRKSQRSEVGGLPAITLVKAGQRTEEETQRLLHELQVHQIELEMQNEELQQSRAEVEAGLERYKDLYDFAPVGYVTLGRDGTIRQVNLTGVRLLGLERARLVNRRFGLFVSDDSRPAFAAFLQKVFESQEKWTCEVALLKEGNHPPSSRLSGGRDHGEAGPLSVRIEATVSGDGQECRAVVVDITERKRAEEALQETSDYLENLITYANAPIIVWDSFFIIKKFNKAFERLTGLAAEEVIGKELNILFPDNSRRQSLDHIMGTQKGERWESVEIPIAHADGGVRTVLWNSATLYKPDGNTVLATIAQGQDITERKRADEALQRYAERLASLREIDRAILAAQSPQAIAETALKHIRRMIPCQRAGVVLFDEEAQERVVLAADTNGPSEVHTGSRAPLERGDLVPCLRRGEAYLVPDLQALSAPTLVEAALRAEGIRTRLSLPLIAQGNFLGALNFGATTVAAFTTEHLEIGREVTDQLAVAIRQARLHTTAVRRGEELAALLRAFRTVMAGLDLQETLDRILGEAAQISGCSHVKVLLVDKEAGVLRVGALQGTAMPPGFQLPLAVGHSGLVASTGQPLFCADAQNDPRSVLAEADRERGIVTYLGLPIKSGDEVLGVLTFNTTVPRQYNPEELAYLASFADQAAIAIENARLYEATVRQLKELKALYDTGQAITSSLSLHEQLGLLVERLSQATGAQRVLVGLGDAEDARCLRLCLAYDVSKADPWLRQLDLSAERYPEIQEVMRTGRPLVIPEVVAEPLLAPVRDHLESLNLRSMVVMPLIVQERAIGAISLGYVAQGRTFTDDEIRLLQSFTAQAATAIEKARLYEAIQQHAAELEARVQERTHELEAANQQLQDASRHKSEFLANMSHELRTPLNSIIGFSELLLEQGAGPLIERQARFMGHIHQGGKHLLRLISDILDLSKVEAGKFVLRPEALPVAATLEDILVIARGLANKKAQEVQADIAPDLPPLNADPVRFKQILFNLLSNAVKFTPEKGNIRLTARKLGSEEVRQLSSLPASQHPSLPAGDLLEIAVTDTGVGIRPQDLPKLFQEFVQLETTQAQKHEGTGLGLALTKRFVELHGGRIWAESNGEGRGSTFTVVLPFSGPGAPAEALAGARSS
jgi:PAS domain S-box-containing protein